MKNLIACVNLGRPIALALGAPGVSLVTSCHPAELGATLTRFHEMVPFGSLLVSRDEPGRVAHLATNRARIVLTDWCGHHGVAAVEVSLGRVRNEFCGNSRASADLLLAEANSRGFDLWCKAEAEALAMLCSALDAAERAQAAA